MGDGNTLKLVLRWGRRFSAGELTVDEIHEHFAALDANVPDISSALRKRIAEAQQELDAIRYGMCESGQRAEIGRIFRELERLYKAEHSES